MALGERLNCLTWFAMTLKEDFPGARMSRSYLEPTF
jgi:hypothetical protein